jgi:hypothetical protein
VNPTIHTYRPRALASAASQMVAEAGRRRLTIALRQGEAVGLLATAMPCEVRGVLLTLLAMAASALIACSRSHQQPRTAGKLPRVRELLQLAEAFPHVGLVRGRRLGIIQTLLQLQPRVLAPRSKAAE